MASEKFFVGIDEAGRGPVLGPLVIGAFAVAKGREQILLKNGAKDSKLLSASTREHLCQVLSAHGFAKVILIEASELDKLMQTLSLNEIEAQKIGELMLEMEKEAKARGGELDCIFADSPDPNPEKFCKRIKTYYSKARVECSNKAESKWPQVAAASIFAKVRRDEEIEKIIAIVGEDFGSGYPSDPKTIAFLKRRLDDEKVARFVRHKWQTVKNLRVVQVPLHKYL